MLYRANAWAAFFATLWQLREDDDATAERWPSGMASPKMGDPQEDRRRCPQTPSMVSDCSICGQAVGADLQGGFSQGRTSPKLGLRSTKSSVNQKDQWDFQGEATNKGNITIPKWFDSHATRNQSTLG